MQSQTLRPHLLAWFVVFEARLAAIWSAVALAFGAALFSAATLGVSYPVPAAVIDDFTVKLLPVGVTLPRREGTTTFPGDPFADGRFGVDPEPSSGEWLGELFERPLPVCPRQARETPLETLLRSDEPARNVRVVGRLQVTPRQTCMLGDCGPGGDLTLVSAAIGSASAPLNASLILDAGWFTQHPCAPYSKRCGELHLGVKVLAFGTYHGAQRLHLQGLCAVPS